MGCSTSRSRAAGDLQVDEHHTVEDVALVLGSAFAAALGDRAGIARFGDARVPMDECPASAVVDVGGRPYAVVDLPFRGERVGELPLQLVEHAIEAFARTAGATIHVSGHGPERPPPRRGGVQVARSRAPRRLRAGSAPVRGRLHEGRPRLMAAAAASPSSTTAPGTWSASAARSTTVGADVDHRRRPRRTRPGRRARRARRRRRRPGDGPARASAASSSRSVPGSPPAGRSSGSASGCSSCTRAATRTAPSTLGLLAGRTVAARRRPDAAPHRLEPGRAAAATTRCSTASADGADLYFVHSYVGRPRRPGHDRRRRRPTARRSRASSLAGRVVGVQFHPERSGADGLRILANFVRPVAAPGGPAVTDPGLAPPSRAG